MRLGQFAEMSIGKMSRRGLLVLTALSVFLFFTFQYVSPLGLLKLGAMGLAACAVGLVAFAVPKYGLLLAVLYIYTGLSYYFHFHAAHPLVLLVAAAVAYNMMRGERLELRSAGFNWSVVLFLMFIVQSLLVAYNVSLSLTELGRVLKPLVMVYLVVQLIRTPRDLNVFVLVMYFGVLASVILGLANLLLGFVEAVTITPTGEVRFSGTHGGPNTYAVYLASALPLGIYVARIAPRWYWRVLVVIGTLLILTMIFTTYSRAAVIPVAFVAVAILARDVRSKVVFPLALAGIAAAALLTPVSYWQRLSSLGEFASGQSSDWSLFLRLQSMEIAWNLFLAHPFTGVGLGNFIIRSGPYMFHRIDVHSSYLQVLVGVGLFGFLAYMAAYASAAAHAVTAMRARWSKEYAWMRHLTFYLLVGFLSTLAGIVFGTDAFEYLTWLPAAGCLAAGRIALRYHS
jgi:O-antigen ligase